MQIPHSAFVNFLLSMRKRPGLVERDVLLAVTTISFDIAGLELMLPLIAGAQVVIATRQMAIDGRRMASAIEEFGVSVMQATPATWRLLLDSGWTGSRAAQSVVRRRGAQPANSRTNYCRAPDRSGICTGRRRLRSGLQCTRWNRATIRYRSGSAIDNTPLYILDGALEPVPIGVSGELHIGGAGVARGYLDRPELTQAKFIPDPFGTRGGRLYKTGDVCRYLADGSIAFLGRLDDQVKIRGHRIELGDIESVLLRHPDVNEAVVIVNESPSAGKRLIAYLTGHAGGRQAPGGELREQLAQNLPEYMIPAGFVYLDALPLTPNCKVDRKSLRALPVTAIVEQARA